MGTSKRQQPQQLPEKLRLIRRTVGCTQSLLCEFLDVSQSNISYYESGKRPVPLGVVGAYVKFANLKTCFIITCDDLLFDENQYIFKVFK